MTETYHEETRPLTRAQRQHLLALNAEKVKIEAEIERFVGYLAIEHDTPADQGWTRIDPDKGFVRMIEAPPEENDE
jgi:hypothetical protein